MDFDTKVIELAVYKQSGRPKQGQQPDSYEYQIIGDIRGYN
jgi:hypothetical protein